MTKTKEEYIKFFSHMQEEDKKEALGGMAWDEIVWWIYDAVHTDKLFTEKELTEMFPDLLGYIVKQNIKTSD